MILLDGARETAEHGRLSYSRHVLEAYLLGTGGYHLVGDIAVILHCMYGRRGDAERGLRCHAGLCGPLDARYDVAHVVESAEDTGYVHALCVLHLIHKLPHVIGYGVHAQCVQAAIEHVRLNPCLIEGLAESAYGIVRVLSREQVDLLEGTTVGLHTGEAAHVYDDRRDALQLVFARLELTRRLPHVTIYETELYFLFHLMFMISLCLSFVCDIIGSAKLGKKSQTAVISPCFLVLIDVSPQCSPRT